MTADAAKPDTVLIVEDDREIRQFLQHALTRLADYNVILAKDGHEGLTRALEEQPSVMLLDLALPYIDGLEIMETLREQQQEIPTIVITAHGRVDTVLRAFRLGAKDFLQKPFKIREVWSALKNALTEERLRRERDKLTQALAVANRRQQRQLENWVALNYIAKIITSTLDEGRVLERVIVMINHLLKVEGGALLLVDPADEAKLRFAMTLRGEASSSDERVVSSERGIVGWVARHGKPLLVPDVRADDRFDPAVDQLPGLQTHSVLCVPLKNKEEILGVFAVVNKQEGPESPAFVEEDLRILKSLASWITIAVQNARHNQSLQRHAATKTFRQGVITLAHYINNQLMTHALELESVEQADAPAAEKLQRVLNVSRTCTKKIATVVQALDQLSHRNIPTVAYVGSEDMIDIEALLEAADTD
jgi:DNA-binding response OmpR family regulator